MAPIVRSLPSCVKDSQHALQIFRYFNFLGKNKLIFTMDITSLYTVTPNCEGLLALKHFLIYELLWNQARKHCSAWDPGNVGYIEHQFFNQYNGPKPDLYRRYIDDCVGATSSTREELNQFITAVNSFHPALKYTWEISDTSLAFLDIKVFVEGHGLSTSVHYKPTDSHSYLLYSSSHPSHVKNSIPYSQFLRLRRLCSEDSDFSLKSEEMCEFFGKRGYPAPVVEAGHHRAQQIDRQSALQTSQKENNNRIPFNLTFHPHNHAVNPSF